MERKRFANRHWNSSGIGFEDFLNKTREELTKSSGLTEYAFEEWILVQVIPTEGVWTTIWELRRFR